MNTSHTSNRAYLVIDQHGAVNYRCHASECKGENYQVGRLPGDYRQLMEQARQVCHGAEFAAECKRTKYNLGQLQDDCQQLSMPMLSEGMSGSSNELERSDCQKLEGQERREGQDANRIAIVFFFFISAGVMIDICVCLFAR